MMVGSSTGKEKESEEKAQVPTAGEEKNVEIDSGHAESIERAALVKSEGNELFANEDYEGAVKKYTEALDILKSGTGKGDSVILANRAAAHMGMKKWITACRDAHMSAELDQDNWKAYWRMGISLMRMVPKRFRTQKAIEAFERCMKCTTLPEAQKDKVAKELQKARSRLQQQEDETPMPEGCHIS